MEMKLNSLAFVLVRSRLGWRVTETLRSVVRHVRFGRRRELKSTSSAACRNGKLTHSPIAARFRIYSRSLYISKSIPQVFTGTFRGVWLGMLSRKELHEMDRLYHLGWRPGGFRPIDHMTSSYNSRGLWAWEREVVERYFRAGSRILLLAAGAGRELLALTEMGFAVDAYECNPDLAARGNQLLAEAEVPLEIRQMARDRCPSGAGSYDGAIVGWAAYMLIPGQRTRQNFLQSVAERLKPDSPLMVSFFGVRQHDLELRVTYHVGRNVRRLLARSGLELGDSLAPTYVHYFTGEQIEAELSAAGLRPVFFAIPGYGRAVGKTGSVPRHAERA